MSINIRQSVIISLIFINMSFVTSTNAAPQDNETGCGCNKHTVTFHPNTIFDEKGDDVLFLHHWANLLHITTKKITLENEAAFFLEKCEKTDQDLAELERHLRSRKYLRDAKVSADASGKNIKVETWDNWSLMPTVSFGRKGGVNTYSVGIKDRNLFGLGIDAEIESFTNSQRSGYKFDTQIPLFQKQNTELSLRFSKNDDGRQKALFLTKIFASFYTPYAYNIGFDDEIRNDTIFQNGEDLTTYKHEIDYKTLSFSWLNFNTKKYNLRYSLGATRDFNHFSSAENYLSQPELLPRDRNFTYPWMGFEFTEQDFRELTNIHLITQIEDFNFGWHVKAQLGVADGKKNNSAWALWQANISKGFALNNNALLLFDFAFSGDIYDQQENRYVVKTNTEFFYRFSKKWGYYFNNTNVFSQNQYLDQPITLGGDSGLRGFPLQYLHGNNSVKFTNELRYYPHINVFKLFELAGALFIDNGKISGGVAKTNIDQGWVHSLGIGARIYSAHAVGKSRVIHIDLAKPFSQNSQINGFELRLQAKQSF